jgi:hypothetical protein
MLEVGASVLGFLIPETYKEKEIVSKAPAASKHFVMVTEFEVNVHMQVAERPTKFEHWDVAGLGIRSSAGKMNLRMPNRGIGFFVLSERV